MLSPKTACALVVKTEDTARALVNELVTNSQWFAFEPLPDDEYEFWIKLENLARVQKFLGREIKSS